MARHIARLLLLGLFISQGSAWALVEHVTTYKYDDFDRLISVTDAHGSRDCSQPSCGIHSIHGDKTLRYGYDLNGNRIQLTDSDSKVTLTTFDELNRTTSVKTQAGTTSYIYDRSSLLTQTKYPNNTKETTEYDNARRIRNITNTQNSAVVSQYDYQYDANGNRTQQIEINGGAAQTTTYTYDTLDRLTHVEYPDNSSTTYTYDDNYNRLTETVTGSTPQSLTYTYNARNQLTQISDALNAANNISYSFDDNGNQISKTHASTSLSTRFVYDARNHLRLVSTCTSPCEAEEEVASFLYNASGLRIEKQGERGTELYTYDDNSLLQEYNSSSATLAKYDYGAHKLISLIHATEPTQYYLTDALNSVVDLTNTNGQVQARYQYDAFGNKRAESGSSANRFAFTGYTEDRETNLLYAKARYYDSDTGRFLSQDAWEGKTDTPPSLHRYLYAYQNPTVYIDPTGNFVVTSALNEDAEEASKIISDHIASMNTELNGELANDTAIRLGSIVEKMVGNAASLVGSVSGLADSSIDAGIGAVYGGELFGQNSRNRTADRVDSAVGGAKSAYAFSQRDDALSVVADHASGGMQNFVKELQSGDLNAWSGVGAGSAELLLGGIASRVSKLPKITVESAGSARGATVPMSAVTDAEAGMAYSHPVGQVANKLKLTYSVETKANEAFFWSGKTDGIGGESVARKIASDNKGTTLEALMENRNIQMPVWDATNPEVVKAWKAISSDYAVGASGTVRAVIGQSLRLGNVWETAELPTLIKNANVDRIITIDPVTKIETEIFVRSKK